MRPNLRERIRKPLPSLRSFTPKTLFGRSMLTIILPIVIMQIAVIYIFFDRHWQSVSTSLSEGVVGDIAMVLDMYQQNPDQLERIKKLSLEKMNLSVALQPEELLPTSTHSSFNSPLDRTLRRALSSKITDPFWFDTNRFPAYIDIRIQINQDIVRFIAPRDKVYATTGNIFVIWLVGTTLLLTGIAILFTRAQLRPIQQLAQFADRLGKGQETTDFKPTGALEIRQASEAFIQMQKRISKFISQRTEMLAGVSHDLRTPLTRLKLQFAMMEKTPELDAARKDLQNMQDMLEGYLDFAKGETEADPKQMDLAQMIKELAPKIFPKHRIAQISLDEPLLVMVRPQSIERCISNLLENAMRYADKVWVNGKIEGEQIIIQIEDNGQGIAAEFREEAFRPFSRLDAARNLNTEGVGLGLSIARDAAHAHGGEIHLQESIHGGLLVELILPQSKS
ncbi:MAG: HAMP domain-containing protein [Robiginitomaculum sp.]|nr:HAMP domain-containing protein [Robiginitomaculum sp.]